MGSQALLHHHLSPGTRSHAPSEHSGILQLLQHTLFYPRAFARAVLCPSLHLDLASFSFGYSHFLKDASLTPQTKWQPPTDSLS